MLCNVKLQNKWKFFRLTLFAVHLKKVTIFSFLSELSIAFSVVFFYLWICRLPKIERFLFYFFSELTCCARCENHHLSNKFCTRLFSISDSIDGKITMNECRRWKCENMMKWWCWKAKKRWNRKRHTTCFIN